MGLPVVPESALLHLQRPPVADGGADKVAPTFGKSGWGGQLSPARPDWVGTPSADSDADIKQSRRDVNVMDSTCFRCSYQRGRKGNI